jgi:hypothetical protein
MTLPADSCCLQKLYLAVVPCFNCIGLLVMCQTLSCDMCRMLFGGNWVSKAEHAAENLTSAHKQQSDPWAWLSL